MKRIHRSCSALVAVLLCLIFGLQAQANEKAGTKSLPVVVVYPFSVDTGVPDAKQSIAEELTVQICSALSNSGKMVVSSLHRNMGSVQRAIQEQKLADDDVLKPVDTGDSGIARIRKYSSVIGGDFSVIGSVDGYKLDTEKGELSITSTLKVLDGITGRVCNSVVVTGKASNGSKAWTDDTESSLRAAACQDIISNSIQSIAMSVSNDQPSEDGKAEKVRAHPSSKQSKLIWAVIWGVSFGVMVH